MPCVTCGRAFASRTLPNATFFSLCCLLDMKYSSRPPSRCPMSMYHVPPCHFHLCRVRHLAQCCSLGLSTCFVHLWVQVDQVFQSHGGARGCSRICASQCRTALSLEQMMVPLPPFRLASLFVDPEPFANMATIFCGSFSAPVRAPAEPKLRASEHLQARGHVPSNSRRAAHLRHTPHQPPSEMTAADVLTCMLVFKEFPISCFLCFLSTWPDAEGNSQVVVSIQTDPNFASSAAGVVCRTFGHSPHVGERLPPNVECAVVISSNGQLPTAIFRLLRHSDPPTLSPHNVFLAVHKFITLFHSRSRHSVLEPAPSVITTTQAPPPLSITHSEWGGASVLSGGASDARGSLPGGSDSLLQVDEELAGFGATVDQEFAAAIRGDGSGIALKNKTILERFADGRMYTSSACTLGGSFTIEQTHCDRLHQIASKYIEPKAVGDLHKAPLCLST